MRSISGLPAVLLFAGGIGTALGMAGNDVAAASKVRPTFDQSPPSELKLSHAKQAMPGKVDARRERTIADLREKMILHNLML